MRKFVAFFLVAIIIATCSNVAKAERFKVVNIETSLNVRDAPYGGKVIGGLPNGAIVEGEYVDSWKVKINYKGKVGYIYTGYLEDLGKTEKKPSKPTNPVKPTKPTKTTNADKSKPVITYKTKVVTTSTGQKVYIKYAEAYFITTDNNKKTVTNKTDTNKNSYKKLRDTYNKNKNSADKYKTTTQPRTSIYYKNSHNGW